MATSEFWRRLAAKFRDIQDGDLIHADWVQLVGGDEPMKWTITGCPDDIICTYFKSLATEAGLVYGEPNALVAWLNAVRKESPIHDHLIGPKERFRNGYALNS